MCPFLKMKSPTSHAYALLFSMQRLCEDFVFKAKCACMLRTK
ncbi:hypothetical protein HHE02_15820 [Helicobacter heilmannii]|uniref:Uncharacterized protein n=1 Tax=Helicobacter heilmannii TaxID=35817 RepID=A0A0K2Y052_HELHE|nr:hypothetical protein BN341_11670 [Helicobacter heilmannii ASB1.4]CRF45643.1 hypothetical protein HHE014_06110 [Helicobacter heilmannii]CRF48260.1 hypothetical protein HHE02_15820 [Helicobacter heilmannii]CRF49915.1 hypothetical protein HHE03_15960 [Helicobacter heilmannii]CRF51712.1 hypothetical protein HHE06_16080 [Helicobacter heilmannii]